MKEEKIKKEKRKIIVDKIINGLLEESFYVGNDENISIDFISMYDIFYDGRLIIKKNNTIPYYNKVQLWDEEQFKGGYADVVLDFRPNGLYGKDFDIEKLGDGKGGYGESLLIEVVPTISKIKFSNK